MGISVYLFGILKATLGDLPAINLRHNRMLKNADATELRENA